MEYSNIRNLPVSYIKLKQRYETGMVEEIFFEIHSITIASFTLVDGKIERCDLAIASGVRSFDYADNKHEIDQLYRIFNEISVEGKVDEETTEQRELLQESGSQTEQTSE